MRWPMYRMATVGLALATAWSAYEAIWLLGHPLPPPTVADVRVSEETSNAKSAEISRPPVEADYSQSLLRPLFNPTRKPFTSASIQETTAEPPPEPPRPVEVPAPSVVDASVFKLKGVLLSEALDSALIVTTEQPNGQWLRTGAELQGWKLAKIKKDQVVLIQNGQTLTLQLYVDNPQKPL
jgi:hypothetical protein